MSSITIDDLTEMIEVARRRVILQIPMTQADVVKMGVFFTERLPNGQPLPTAATDGKSIGFNPYFVASISEEDREFVVGHEWVHKMLKHFVRVLKLKQTFSVWTPHHDMIANEAADYEGNFFLEQCGFKLIEGALRDKRFDGMPMEEIFQILLHENPAPIGEPGDEPGGGEPGDQPSEDQSESNEGESDDPIMDEQEEGQTKADEAGEEGDEESDDGGGADGDEQESEGPAEDAGSSPGGNRFGSEQMEGSDPIDPEKASEYKVPSPKKWGTIVTDDDLSQSEIDTESDLADMEQSNSIATSKLSGKLPEAIERILNDIKTQSKNDWVSEIAEFIDDTCGEDSDVSWARPNKRFASMDIYMPSPTQEGIGEIAVLIDSSGSMDEKMYQLAATETSHLINAAKPSKAVVIEFTTDIVSVAEYEDGIELNEAPSRASWGGTDVCIGFDWVKENMPNVTGIIVISDMEFFRWPEDEGIKVLWAKVPPSEDHAWYFGTPPFGKSITVR